MSREPRGKHCFIKEGVTQPPRGPTLIKEEISNIWIYKGRGKKNAKGTTGNCEMTRETRGKTLIHAGRGNKNPNGGRGKHIGLERKE